MKYHTLQEAGEILGVSWKRVRQWVRNGELSAINVSTNRRSKKPQFRVSIEAIEQFEMNRSVDPPVARFRRVRTRGEYVPKILTA